MDAFMFWWSVISTSVGAVFLYLSIWQYFAARKESEKQKAQVKIWMQDANGLNDSLIRVAANSMAKKFSSVEDVGYALMSIQAVSFALYQSLYEERCVTEEE